MRGRSTVVLDTGKALAKLSLWTDGELIRRRSRPNERIDAGDYLALDAAGIEDWVAETLREFASLADVGAIIPVAHGAAAAIARNASLVCPPVDYEDPIPEDVRADYDRLRDDFSHTGSPPLPAGLNLGVQIFRLERLMPDLLADGAVIMPWAQYWSWVLSGVAASEVSSLGCHTDLWQPAECRPSKLAVDRGWAGHLAPIRRAGEALGRIKPEWAKRTGLRSDVTIHCGLHDSNAARVAARAFPQFAQGDVTVLSTGTWFVTMRSLVDGANFSIASLDPSRDCLVNVDVSGLPVPSARFMGGREIEILMDQESSRIDISDDQADLFEAVDEVVSSGAMVLPTFAPNVGPFPHQQGRWINLPTNPEARRAAVGLYAALMADVELDLIRATKRLLIEGRFAGVDIFVRGLAKLRPELEIFTSNENADPSCGALRMIHGDLPTPGDLSTVTPVTTDLSGYRRTWWQHTAQGSRCEGNFRS